MKVLKKHKLKIYHNSKGAYIIIKGTRYHLSEFIRTKLNHDVVGVCSITNVASYVITDIEYDIDDYAHVELRVID